MYMLNTLKGVPLLNAVWFPPTWPAASPHLPNDCGWYMILTVLLYYMIKKFCTCRSPRTCSGRPEHVLGDLLQAAPSRVLKAAPSRGKKAAPSRGTKAAPNRFRNCFKRTKIQARACSGLPSGTCSESCLEQVAQNMFWWAGTCSGRPAPSRVLKAAPSRGTKAAPSRGVKAAPSRG